MDEPLHSCSKSGDGIHTVKNGKTSDGRQRYKCMNCGKRFLKKYSYKAYLENVNINIVNLLKEGVGIRSTGRLLKISPTTVISRILNLSKQVKKPMIVKGKTYELDELCTYIGNKNNRPALCGMDSL